MVGQAEEYKGDETEIHWTVESEVLWRHSAVS